MAKEIVLITGATAGIGLELARCFARGGSDLVLVARREERLREIADGLSREHGVNCREIVEDLGDAAGAERLVERLERDGIAIDVLVNNAGAGTLGKFVEQSLDTQLGPIQLNVASLVELTHRLLPGMRERRRGGILNVASTAAFQPGPNMAVYYATKAFVLCFSEGLREELRGSGVRVSCLCPGPTRTEFAGKAGMTHLAIFRKGAMPADAVARAGYDGFRRGKTIVVPGLRNKIGVFAVRLFPRSWVRKLVGRLH